MTLDFTPPNFDSFHEDAIEGAKPGPWDGYSRLDRLDGLDSRTLDDLIAPFPPVPARSVARPVEHEPVGDWSLKLTLMCAVPVVLIFIAMVGLLIVDQVKW